MPFTLALDYRKWINALISGIDAEAAQAKPSLQCVIKSEIIFEINARVDKDKGKPGKMKKNARRTENEIKKEDEPAAALGAGRTHPLWDFRYWIIAIAAAR